MNGIQVYPDSASAWLMGWVGTNVFFVALRLYGPVEPWIEKTWRPGEIEHTDD